MGFYLRKALSLGPLRFNLSRSGVGTSFGVKGARIGVGPRGSYFHAGRGGLYYRTKLDGSSSTPVEPERLGAQAIDSGSTKFMVDIESALLVRHLTAAYKRTSLRLIVAGVIVVVAIALGLVEWRAVVPANLAHWRLPAYGLLSVVSVAALIYAVSQDRKWRAFTLQYKMDEESQKASRHLNDVLHGLRSCGQIWHIPTTSPDGVERVPVEATVADPPGVNSMVPITALPAGEQVLFFTPDRLLVYDADSVGSVPYSEMTVDVVEVSFKETATVPKDTEIVGSSWIHENKDGGQDRRYGQNREVPLVKYGQISFRSRSGLNERFFVSNLSVATELVTTLRAIARIRLGGKVKKV
jgi:hypothetical protein